MTKITRTQKPRTGSIKSFPTVKASKLHRPNDTTLNGKRVVLDKSLEFAFRSLTNHCAVTRKGGKRAGDVSLTVEDRMANPEALTTNLKLVLPRDLKKGDVFVVKNNSAAVPVTFEVEVGFDVAKARREAERSGTREWAPKPQRRTGGRGVGEDYDSGGGGVTTTDSGGGGGISSRPS